MTTDFKLSIYQQNIFNFISSGSGNAIIEAVAGSGKTTTIVKALNLIPETQKAIFLAFNKSIADELRRRVPKTTTASTFHSAGYKALSKEYHFTEVDENKVFKIAYEIIGKDKFKQYGQFVIRLVSLAKQNGIGCLVPDMATAWEELVDHFDLDIDCEVDQYDNLEIEAIHVAQRVLQISIEESEISIDYNDMIYMPIYLKLPFDKYDWVFIDEAQDLNNVRRYLASMLLSDSGRLVAVGDPNQAIYGFTGADSDSMQIIKEKFHCKTFPLSVSYRCSKAIVLKAKELVPVIEPSETAPDGIVLDGTTFTDTPTVSTDAILCRNTAPLISLAYKFIAKDIRCKVLGREIGQGLLSLIQKLDATTIEDLEQKLSKYSREQVGRYISRNQESKAQALRDKVECLTIMIDNLKENNLFALRRQINALFGDQATDTIILSTVHKAKGLEWNRVFIYRPDLMPSPYANQGWELEQEKNLQYVAITRAKQELYYVRE